MLPINSNDGLYYYSRSSLISFMEQTKHHNPGPVLHPTSDSSTVTPLNDELPTISIMHHDTLTYADYADVNNTH